MNRLELRMVDILKELKEKYGGICVRAEFEAEGTKLEELLRLKEICMTAGLGLTLKIGGCESIRDMLEAKIVGVDCLVAPMVESAYALRKYLQAVNKIFAADEKENIEIFCNVETATALQNFEEMLTIPEISTLGGIVIERVDLCFSLGLGEGDINSAEINTRVRDIAAKAKRKDLLCNVGGGVSAHSLAFFRSIPRGHLNRYETRKVCFACPEALEGMPEKGILKALGFELLWLKNKLNFYKAVSTADKERINLIEHRYLTEIEALI
ncbi:MAG: aldolase/citrate lyase family protein [Candidatus Aureabacteria bacterium]|nr:aldolase/citrate lyase family protein [Candidatus Auribacterota bacterium]